MRLDLSEKEILSKVEYIWKDEYKYSYSKPIIGIECLSKGKGYTISLHRMYDSPPLNLTHLKALSEFFETDNINDVDRWNNGGCETCDFGSNYGFKLSIKP